MKFLLWLTLLSVRFNSLFSYELSICTIFRDDAKYLPEWIDFHIQQGVEHFYLYNNLSTDNPKMMLRAYIKAGIVELIDWPFESNGQDFFIIQCNSYLDCVSKNRKDKWIAFLDSDEFLFCPDKRKIIEFLKDYESFAGVAAHWVFYGTSNTIIPKGENLLDHLVYRADLNFNGHKITKPILQPKYIGYFPTPHFAILKKNCIEDDIQNCIVDENKELVNNGGSKKLTFNKIRINHYWTRDLNYFHNIKIPRRLKWYPKEDQLAYEKIINEVYDPILSRKSD